MIDHVGKRFLALLLVAVMVFSVMPASASATSVTVVDDKITVADNQNNLTLTDGVVSATATANASSGCTGTTYTPVTNNITITNNSGSTAIIGFTYTVESAGSFNVCGITDVATGSYSGTLDNGASFTVTLTSKNNADVAKITLSGFTLTVDETRTVTFTKPVNGTATAGGTDLSALADGAVHTVRATYADGIAVTATAASGYTFLAWLDGDNNIISTVANTTLKPTADMTVRPVFVANSDTQGWWQTSGKAFTDLNAAATAAAAGDKIVVLMRNATLNAGTYTIPAGVTLLIPFDAINTLYTTIPAYLSGSNAYISPSPYRTLTMENGAKLNVQGALSVSAKHATIRGGQPGSTPTDKYGYIKMNAGSAINVTGSLYAWGYISGDGIITAENGSVVYENMQFTDFRGGSITMGMISNEFFPMAQYYVQNIETMLILKPGASEYAIATLEASEKYSMSTVKFIGPSGAMFTTGANTTVTKDYIPSTDRMEFTVDGDMTINSMSLSVDAPILGQIDVNSADYVLPINNNIDITLISGTTTVNQNLALLPGVKLTIHEAAEVVLSKTAVLHVYDRDDYVGKSYLHNNNDLICAPYSPDPSRVTRTPANLVDAVIDVNGTMYISGGFYTTTGGARIISSEETGLIVYNENAGTATVTQQNNVEGKETPVAITSAKLLNGDGTTYVETAGTTKGSAFAYNADKDAWEAVTDLTVTYDPNGGEGEAATTTYTVADILAGNNTHTVADNTYTNGDMEFTGWNTKADGNGTAYAPGAVFTVTENVTLYAQWKSDAYTITFNPNGADNTMEDQTVASSDTTATLNANTLTREGYRFAGWATTADGEVAYEDGATIEISGNVELYAVWVQQVTITFHDGENTAEQTVDAGTDIALNSNPFVPAEGYSFAGWATEQGGEVVYTDNQVVNFSAKTNLYAVWTANTYKLIWNIDGVTSEETLAYGAAITAPADPTKEGHTFNGWLGDTIPATMPAEDLTITLTSQWQVKQFTITFNTDGGTPVDPITADFGSVITPPAVPTKEGHTFLGWSPELPATMPAEDLKLTALWQVNSYNLVFYVDTEVVYNEQVPFGTPITPPSTPTKEGHTFAGWNPAVPATMPAHDLTFEATWTVNSYTITFDTDGGSEIAPITDYYLAGIIVPEAPTKLGHTFVGWDQEIPATMPAGNMTIKALWSVNSYPLTYISDGVQNTVKVPYGANPADYLPTDLTKEGYNFGGWTNLPATMPAEGITVEAIWNVGTYTLTFLDGESLLFQESLEFGTPITAPVDPVKEGYNFQGWDADGDGLIDEVAATMPGENTTYVAVYQVLQYTITFWDDMRNVLDQQVLDYGATIVVPEVSKEGYTFLRWNEEIPATMPAHDVDITSTWEANEYTITFLLNDENDPYYVITARTGEDISGAMPPDPTKDHFTFAGWSETVPATMPAGGLTVSATWTPNEYLVSFINGNEILQATNVPYGTVPVYTGETPTQEADAQYTYTFACWITEDGTLVERFGPVTGETYYYAAFHKTLNTYTVTWKNWNGDVLEVDEDGPYGSAPEYNGETPERAATAEYTYTFNGWGVESLETVTGDVTYTAVYLSDANWYDVYFTINGEEYGESRIPYGSAIEAPGYTAPEGYSFSGWDIPESMPAHDLYLDATQTVNTYTITWNLDGGTFALENPSELPTSAQYGSAVEVLGLLYKVGYNLVHLIDQDGNILVNTWPGSDMDEYMFTMPAKDVTITAVWDIKTFTVTWTDWDGTILETDYDVPYGSAPEYNGETPTRAADEYNTYTFAAWGPNDVTEIKKDETFMAAYTATPIVYTVTFLTDETELTDLKQAVGYETEITLPTLDDTSEKTFMYWHDDAGNIYEGGDVLKVTGNLTLRASWMAQKYTLTVKVLATGEKVELSIPYGENLLDALESAAAADLIPDIGDTFRVNDEDMNGQRTVTGYIYWDVINGEWFFDLEGLTMPACDIEVEQGYDYQGWNFWYDDDNYFGAEYCGEDGWLHSGWHYIEEDFDDVDGGAWYYFLEDPYVSDGFLRVEGITRVPYPEETIEGNTYAPDPEALQYAEENGLEFIDKDTGLFWFDENGKFQHDKTGFVPGEDVSRWAINGLIAWHPGLVEYEGEYYYFPGDEVNGGNFMATGDVYVGRNTTDLDVTISGVYTFADDGKLCKYNGITEMTDGTLRYYEDYQLMAGKGLIKIGDDYYYVRSNGELVVGTSYWVANVNEYTEIAVGMYDFDAEGKLIIPVPDPVKDGIYYENGGWFYYEDGVIGYNKGLIATYKNWFDAEGNDVWGEGGYIYVRSNGQLATGEYYVTNLANYDDGGIQSGDKITFNEMGLMRGMKNGIVEENGVLYYYESNRLAAGAGLIEIDGSYYYVRSGGQLAVSCDYWVTNVNDTGVEPGCYTFGADGVMVYRDGVVEENGGLFYYVNGKLACSAGVVEIEEGVFIYVRSNGQLATGEYWPTNTNGLLDPGMYDFGTDGRYVKN